MKDSNPDPVIIFAGTSWEANLLKSLLENAQIESFLRDESMGMIAPWYTSPGGAGAVKVVVSATDFEMAKEVVDRYLENLR